MTREIVIASVQLPAFPKGETDAGKKEYNFQMAEYWLDQAGQQGAGIACVGEEFNVHGIDLSYDNFQEQVAGDFEAVIHRLGAVARRRRMYIIAPIYGTVSGVRRNIAILLDRSGDTLGGYLKVHCIENERALTGWFPAMNGRPSTWISAVWASKSATIIPSRKAPAAWR